MGLSWTAWVRLQREAGRKVRKASRGVQSFWRRKVRRRLAGSDLAPDGSVASVDVGEGQVCKGKAGGSDRRHLGKRRWWPGLTPGSRS